MFSSSKRFNGEIHVIFNKSQDALAFVQQSKLTPINYGNGYTLVCKLLNDDLNKDLIKQEDQHSFIKGKRIETMNTYYLNEMIFFCRKIIFYSTFKSFVACFIQYKYFIDK
jgi:hypothetical protein